VIPVQFEYARPESLKGVFEELAGAPGAALLAGGQALVPALTLGLSAPPKLVDLRRVSELRGIASGPPWRIGAMTTLDEIATAAGVRQQLPAVLEAIEAITDPAVRNRSTLGGNLATRPAMTDLPAVVMALEATLRLVGPDGPRNVATAAFFEGADGAGLRRDEVIAGVDLIGAPASAYERIRNSASGYALCGVAAVVETSSAGKVTRCRVAVTAAVPRPSRLRTVEAALEGQSATPERVAAAAQQVVRERLDFVSDFAASGEYRAQLTAVLAERALLRAIERGAPRAR